MPQKYRFLSSVLIFNLLSSIFLSTCLAKDYNFDITIDRNKIPLGQAFQLNVTFNNTQNMPALELGNIEGFQSRYVGPSTSMSIVNGQVSSSITHIYNLIPLKTGVLPLGPFKFHFNSDTYSSNALTVEVVEAAAAQNCAQEAENPTESKDLTDRIFLLLQPKKTNVYLNEVVPVKVKLYVNRLGVRDIQFPEVTHEGFSLGKFGQPKQYQEPVGNILYDVIEFEADVFALRPGQLSLGPAGLKCNLIAKKESRRQSSDFDNIFGSDVFDDFFGRYAVSPLDLKSKEVPIAVLDLPQEGRPLDYSGAVGEFSLETSCGPKEIKVGDPVTLKMAVKGEGNFNTVEIPKLKSTQGFKVYDPQVKQEKGQKTFEQILIPLSDDIKEVPGVVFSFFNPHSGQYQVLERESFGLKVVKPEKEETQKVIEGVLAPAAGQKEESLGRDLVYIKDAPGELKSKGTYLYKNKLFIGFQLIFLIAYLFILFMHNQSQKLRSDVVYARKLSAPKKARDGIRKVRMCLEHDDVKGFYDALFNTLQEYLGDRFHLASKGITISIVEDALKNKPVSLEAMNSLKILFAECDMARYAPAELGRDNMQLAFKKLEESIGYFQSNKL